MPHPLNALQEIPFTERDLEDQFEHLRWDYAGRAKEDSLPQLNQFRTRSRFAFFDKEERTTFRDAVCRLHAERARRIEPMIKYGVGAFFCGAAAAILTNHSGSRGFRYAGYAHAALGGLVLLCFLYHFWQFNRAITEDAVRSEMDEIEPVYTFIRQAPPNNTTNPTVLAVLNDQARADPAAIKKFKGAYSAIREENADANCKFGLTLVATGIFSATAAGCLTGPHARDVHNFGIFAAVIACLTTLYALYNFSQSWTKITAESIATKLER